MNQELFDAAKKMADEITKKDEKMGFYAQRKINAISPSSSIDTIIKVSEDIALIAGMIE